MPIFAAYACLAPFTFDAELHFRRCYSIFCHALFSSRFFFFISHGARDAAVTPMLRFDERQPPLMSFRHFARRERCVERMALLRAGASAQPRRMLRCAEQRRAVRRYGVMVIEKAQRRT